MNGGDPAGERERHTPVETGRGGTSVRMAGMVIGSRE